MTDRKPWSLVTSAQLQVLGIVVVGSSC